MSRKFASVIGFINLKRIVTLNRLYGSDESQSVTGSQNMDVSMHVSGISSFVCGWGMLAVALHPFFSGKASCEDGPFFFDPIFGTSYTGISRALEMKMRN